MIYKHPHYGLSVVEFNDGSIAAIDIEVKKSYWNQTVIMIFSGLLWIKEHGM